MNKKQFIAELNASLRRLPSYERQDILQDIEEYFEIGLEEGKTEEQLSASLGSPHQIAKELVATHRVEKVEETATAGNIFRAVWAVIGLGFFNLVIVLGPFVAIAGVIIAGWIAGVSFVASPILVLINVAIHPQIFELFDLFFSIGLAGLGLFILIGMFFATRATTNGFVRYLKYNVRVVKGGMKHVQY
ncbi:HAAS signaling domain-containing protein [Neobacillus sp. SCS-31]|uniref:HAAS signaling domain-containing protein n=1 Tax=Neobacillus oceani TaxID=3115292 RepID=UPI003906ABCD